MESQLREKLTSWKMGKLVPKLEEWGYFDEAKLSRLVDEPLRLDELKALLSTMLEKSKFDSKFLVEVRAMGSSPEAESTAPKPAPVIVVAKVDSSAVVNSDNTSVCQIESTDGGISEEKGSDCASIKREAEIHIHLEKDLEEENEDSKDPKFDLLLSLQEAPLEYCVHQIESYLASIERISEVLSDLGQDRNLVLISKLQNRRDGCREMVKAIRVLVTSRDPTLRSAVTGASALEPARCDYIVSKSKNYRKVSFVNDTASDEELARKLQAEEDIKAARLRG